MQNFFARPLGESNGYVAEGCRRVRTSGFSTPRRRRCVLDARSHVRSGCVIVIDQQHTLGTLINKFDIFLVGGSLILFLCCSAGHFAVGVVFSVAATA
jgi:hypothetical protein